MLSFLHSFKELFLKTFTSFFTVALFLISCLAGSFVQSQPQETDFYIVPQNYERERGNQPGVDAFWAHSWLDAALSYKSYCFRISPPFWVIQKSATLAVKATFATNTNVSVESSQTLDYIDYKNKNLTFRRTEGSEAWITDVTIIKSKKCFYSIQFVAEESIYEREKPSLDAFIRNFRP